MTDQQTSSQASIFKPRSIKAIKKLIYTTLIGDVQLAQLLGTSDSIFHEFPMTDKIPHPAVFYSVINENSFPYNESDDNSQLTEVVFGIDIVDDSPNTEKIDDIDNRIFGLFNGKSLKNSEVRCKGVCKRTFYTQLYDSEVKVWRTTTRYTMVTAPI